MKPKIYPAPANTNNPNDYDPYQALEEVLPILRDLERIAEQGNDEYFGKVKEKYEALRSKIKEIVRNQRFTTYEGLQPGPKPEAGVPLEYLNIQADKMGIGQLHIHTPKKETYRGIESLRFDMSVVRDDHSRTTTSVRVPAGSTYLTISRYLETSIRALLRDLARRKTEAKEETKV